MVRPVRVTRRPVMIDPMPMPMLTGSSMRPVCEADSPCTTRR